jgi:GT2 family glycosyltransferase
MKIAALIIGIDGWEKYTKPLIESIHAHEPECVVVVVVDNASQEPYPAGPAIHRTPRLCYSKAINLAHDIAGPADLYIVLSNDVLCTGPFVEAITGLPPTYIVGPCLKETHGYSYLEGWCVAIPAAAWDALGGWDEQFQVSSWEDVDFSQRALEHGFDLASFAALPFTHLDQRQRFTLVGDYWDSERHNVELFMRKRKAAAGGS